MEISSTIVYPIIKQDFIVPSLKSLREMTPPNYSNNEFRNSAFSIPRIVGIPRDIIGIPTPQITISMEVVYDGGDDDIICLMGFRGYQKANK